MTRFSYISVCLTLASLSFVSGCATAKGENADEKRADVQQMRSDALAAIYAKMPQLKDSAAKAPGYGVFSAVSTQSIFVSSGNGFGVIRDNATGKDTYMRAFKLGGGLGAGLQNLHALVIFHDAKTMNDVLEHGWGVTGKAEAAAKVGEEGDAGAVVITLPGMSIYRFTQNGVAIGGAIEGTKVWKDEELN